MEQLENQINQQKLDNWYALQLSRRFNIRDPTELRAAAELYGIHTNTIETAGGQIVRILDKKHRSVAQKPLSYFFI